jgi:hypothetical protein
LVKNGLKIKGEGHEMTDLKRMMDMFREWHRKFYPSYRFDYFIKRLQSLSGKDDLPSFMETMRTLHKRGNVQGSEPMMRAPDGIEPPRFNEPREEDPMEESKIDAPRREGVPEDYKCLDLYLPAEDLNEMDEAMKEQQEFMAQMGDDFPPPD